VGALAADRRSRLSASGWVDLYNAGMANPLTDLLWPAATARFVLLANHVLMSAPAATERLRAHAGRVLSLEPTGWRLPLPVPPTLVLRVTPAGLFEATDEGAAVPDLRLRVDASQPLDTALRVASGEQPSLQIEGDAALATDMNWLIANVRWDIAADLERVFGPAVADTLSRAGGQVASVARGLMQGVAGTLRRS
jgi:ubiquinone biosynthesis accessory factor UbiJ